MGEKIKLKILTPEQPLFEGEVDEILVPTKEGEIGILPKHISLISVLSPGELKIKKGSEWDHFAVMGGFIEVRHDNTCRILASAAEHAESIDEARALEAKKRAKSLLKEAKDEVKFTEASAALARALTRLKVAQRKRKHRVR